MNRDGVNAVLKQDAGTYSMVWILSGYLLHKRQMGSSLMDTTFYYEILLVK